MQTFLPYPSFYKSTKVLDNKRLGKQRVEAQQILNVLNGDTNAWKNHPAVRMWQGYSGALENYLYYCILEWQNRGFENNMNAKFYKNIEYPLWFGNPVLHLSHQSNLMRKLPDYYKKFGWMDFGIEGYYWGVEPKTHRAKTVQRQWEQIGYEIREILKKEKKCE